MQSRRESNEASPAAQATAHRTKVTPGTIFIPDNPQTDYFPFSTDNIFTSCL